MIFIEKIETYVELELVSVWSLAPSVTTGRAKEKRLEMCREQTALH